MQLQIADVNPTGFEPTTTADILTGRCWTVPILHRGRLYARNLDRVVCFNLREGREAGTTGKSPSKQGR